MDGYGGLYISPPCAIGRILQLKEVVLDLNILELLIKCIFITYIIKLVLKNNLFICTLKLKIKFLGVDLEIKNKEKKHPSSQDQCFILLKYSIKNPIALKHIKAHRESDSHKIIDFGSLLLSQRKSSVTSTRLFLYIYYIKFSLKINNFFCLLIAHKK